MTVAELSQWVDSHPLFFALVVIWSLAWKGAALWQAAKRSDRNWFVAILIINFAGILEIIYLLIIIPFKDRAKNSEPKIEN